MEVNGYRITEERHLEPIQFKRLSPEWDRDGVHRWVDVQADDPAALGELLAPLALHPLLQSACLKPQEGLRLAPFDNAVFLSLPVQSHRDTLERSSVVVVCRQGLILTLHFGEIASISRLAQALQQNIRLHAPNSSSLLYQILDHVVNQTANHVIRARDMVESLAKCVNEAPDSVDGGDILSLKRRVSQVAVTGEDQLYAVSNLQTVESTAFSCQGMKEYFRDLAGNLEYIQRSLTRLEGRLNDLQLFVHLSLQEQAEKRLRFLTVISAIFLPMTLVAGIYGMNFEVMPETRWPAGYFLVIGLLFVMGLSMFLYFRRKGWFE